MSLYSGMSLREVESEIARYQAQIREEESDVDDDPHPFFAARLQAYKRSLEMLTEERANRLKQGEKDEWTEPSYVENAADLPTIRFESTDHVRYQNGRDVSGHNHGARRGVEIQPNIWGGEGYTVTIYNQDGNHPLWGDNVQMAPKQMRVSKQEPGKVELRGFGHDPMGEPFSDYGVTVHLAEDTVEKIVLHMHDRSIDIEYLR